MGRNSTISSGLHGVHFSEPGDKNLSNFIFIGISCITAIDSSCVSLIKKYVHLVHEIIQTVFFSLHTGV